LKDATITLIECGKERRLSVQTGDKLPQALAPHGVYIDLPCASRGSCQGCWVLVDGQRRLACQTVLEGDVRVELLKPDEMSAIATGGQTGPVPGNDPLYTQLGVSADIGTTTICAHLLDESGKILSTATRKNPQTRFGADVISRIEKAMSGQGDELAGCVRGTLAEMIDQLCVDAAQQPERIDGLVLTGNTAMLYLLVGQDPTELSRAPFSASRLFGEELDARELGLALAPGARVHLPRCISAFVGGDVTTAIVASGICESDKTCLLVDIGTNGEIALWRKGELICCSTAAGPAFEGAGIDCGVYGVAGAIDRVWVQEGKARHSTIGEGPAVGICGSGIVDAIATMLKLGVIDETGAFAQRDTTFELEGRVCVTPADVRQIQLAKGSVRAGLETLLTATGVDKSQIDTLYIAGGFGSYLDLCSAADIGLIPREMLGRVKVIGNAAHTGATMLLRDKALARSAGQLARQARTIALDANPVFSENFMMHMLLE